MSPQLVSSPLYQAPSQIILHAVSKSSMQNTNLIMTLPRLKSANAFQSLGDYFQISWLSPQGPNMTHISNFTSHSPTWTFATKHVQTTCSLGVSCCVRPQWLCAYKLFFFFSWNMLPSLLSSQLLHVLENFRTIVSEEKITGASRTLCPQKALRPLWSFCLCVYIYLILQVCPFSLLSLVRTQGGNLPLRSIA